MSLVPLSQIVAEAPEGQEPALGLVAILHGENVEVLAVLERTAVVMDCGDRWADKQVVRLSDLFVDPKTLRRRPKAIRTGFPEKRRRRYTQEQRKALRAASDRRARADQARQVEARPAGRRSAAPQPASRTTPPMADAIDSRPVPAAVRRGVSTAPVAPAALQQAASNIAQSSSALAYELRRAQQHIAELESELERHWAVERHLLRRVKLAIGRRAA